MGKCLGCNKKLRFFEGYSSDGAEFCKKCFPKRKEIIEKKKKRARREKEKKEKKEKKEQEDYRKKIKEEKREREKIIKNKDNRKYVLFLDIFCGLSIIGATMWFIPAMLMKDFTNMPETTFNIIFAGLITYILFWITMLLVVAFSEYKIINDKKNWSDSMWGKLVLVVGVIFTYLFYFWEYRPILLKNLNKKNKNKNELI